MYSEEYQLYIVGNVISQECTRIQKKYFVLICTQIEFWSVEKGSSQTQEMLRACKVKIV